MIKSAEIQRPYPLGHGGRPKSKLSDLTYVIKVGSVIMGYITHIDNIKGYESMLDKESEAEE